MRRAIAGIMFTVAMTMTAGEIDLEKRANEVRSAEVAFAKTMEDRDHAAFKRFLADDAMFFGRGPLHGPDAIAEAWKPFFEGEAPFSWKPSRVEVNATGDLALSTGPVRSAQDGQVHSWYVSTWRRESDGTWKIVLDMGTPRCPFPEE